MRTAIKILFCACVLAFVSGCMSSDMSKSMSGLEAVNK